MTALEAVKAYLNTKITKYNVLMREMAEREEPKRTIGFEVNDDE